MKSQTVVRSILEQKLSTTIKEDKYKIEAKLDLLSRLIETKKQKTQDHIRALIEIDVLIFKLIED